MLQREENPMRILVLGAGRMGGWLVEELRRHHEVAVFDTDPKRVERLTGVKKIIEFSEIQTFGPELLVNAVSLPNTAAAFRAVLSYLPGDCVLSDITSVKTGLQELYKGMGRRFVSTHPMFGPTFAEFGNLRNENAILISESDEKGKAFFRDFYLGLGIHIHETTFEEHDKTIAYSLSVPFASSMVFASCMRKQSAPGTTFKKHLDIAKGLLSEDNQLLAEIMFNPHTAHQIDDIASRLAYLGHIIRSRDYEEMQKFLGRLRQNLE
jgi:prephenate dehydrogenase